MADDSFVEPRASEEPYTRIKILGRGAFGEAVLYRKTEVSFVSLVKFRTQNIQGVFLCLRL